MFLKRWRAPRIGATLVLLLAFAVPLFAQLPPLIPRDILFGNPEKASPQISPDGKYLAYLAPKDGVLNVWVRTIGKDDDRVVTDDKKRGIRAYFWADDNVNLLYIQDKDGDENWHLYAVDYKATTPTTRDLTSHEGVQARVYATNPNFPNEILVGLNIRDKRYHDVYRINLQTGAATLEIENPGDVAGWITDPKFQVRGAYASMPDGGFQLRLRDDAKSEWKPFISWGPDDNNSGPRGFTPDGKGLYLSDSRDANTLRLIEIDIATGKQKVLAEDPQYDVGGLIIHPKKYHVQAVAFTKERTDWQVLDKSIEADYQAIRKIHDGDFFLINRDDADKTWLVGFTSDHGPVPYYAYDRATKKATFLFTNRPALEKHKLAPMQPISFTSRDGLTIHGYLSLPVGVEPKNLPMVLNVHGGPWGRDGWGLNSEAQWLANRGYACLQVNFRGSTGYGKKFLNAGNREWAAKMHDDLIDAVDWAIKQGYADPKRVAIYGGSYGGYAALVGATFTPDVFACAVDIVGPSNIVTLIKSIPPYWATLRKVFDVRVGNVDTEEEFLKSRSPLFKADQIKIPLLIAQGANDPRVKQAESEQIVEAMRKASKPVEYMVFPDEGHGFARPENRLKFYAASEAFLAKHLGGRAEPAGTN
jgi:dipeptidyl aminopeptidase/acylaminoacyl peptidase